MKLDYTNWNIFTMNSELCRDPRAPKKQSKPASKKFWITVFSIIGVVVAFGIIEMIMCALHGM